MPGREAQVACYHGWHACVGGTVAFVAWVEWVVYLLGGMLAWWRARVGGMLLLLLLLLLNYYPE